VVKRDVVVTAKVQFQPAIPRVEAATGLLFLLLCSGRLECRCKRWVIGTFCSWLLALSLIDSRYYDFTKFTHPIRISCWTLYFSWLVLLSWVEGVNNLMSGIIGTVLGLWLFDLISVAGSIILGQAAMGGGDPKLAAMLGAWLGWKYLLLSGFLACAVGAFGGGGAIALGWLTRRQPIPFGPFLALGAVITLFGGEAILSAYLRLVFSS
jgi:leader peptidase (prepilin peptidase)/N-methyltransferase